MLRVEAQEGLKEYYVRNLDWPEDKARKVAEYYMLHLVRSYLGSTDESSVTKYATGSLDLSDLDSYLKGWSNVMPGKDKNSLGYFLRLAIVNNYPLSSIKKLVADGAPVEGGYEQRMDTPLMQAVKRPDVAEFLIEHGAKVNAQNSFGKTPLMYAVQYRSKDVIGLLLLHNADINLMTYGTEQCGKDNLFLGAEGRTALMYAAWYGTPEIIQALIAHGANIHYSDSEGETSYDYLNKNKLMPPKQMEQAEQLLWTK